MKGPSNAKKREMGAVMTASKEETEMIVMMRKMTLMMMMSK